MHLRKTKTSKGRIYLAIVDSYYDKQRKMSRSKTVVFFASTFWTKLQNIFGHCCMSILDKVAKPDQSMLRPAI